MATLKTLFIGIALLSIPFSCQKDKTPVGPKDSDVIAHDSHDYPNKIGSWWLYSVYDSLQSHLDTVKVSIVDTALMANDKSVFVWLYESDMVTDTNYVNIQDDTVTIFDEFNDTEPLTKYIFPLRVGNKWRISLIGDTMVVASKDTISAPAGVFEPAFLLKQVWYQLNVGVHILTWLVPKVGIVNQTRRIIGYWEFENTRWELMDYYIPQ